MKRGRLTKCPAAPPADVQSSAGSVDALVSKAPPIPVSKAEVAVPRLLPVP